MSYKTFNKLDVGDYIFKVSPESDGLLGVNSWFIKEYNGRNSEVTELVVTNSGKAVKIQFTNEDLRSHKTQIGSDTWCADGDYALDLLVDDEENPE